MPVSEAPIRSKAFGEHADPDLVVAYQSYQDAMYFLSSELDLPNGVALLQGPAGSGKSTVLRKQQRWSSRDADVAIIDGAQLTPRRLVNEMLRQFGVVTVAQDEQLLLQQLNNFVAQQARVSRVPVLIIDNLDKATTSALSLLNWLAGQEARGSYALKMVLSASESMSGMLGSESMRNVLRRKPKTYCLNPLTVREAVIYLRTRLIAAGARKDQKFFSLSDCEQLHTESAGWPGRLNERASEFMRLQAQKAKKPIPKIIVSRDGVTIAEHKLTERQYVIGRTELADIVIGDTFVSKMHAMLQIYGNAVVLIDLNSTNGTTVNSRVIQKTILKSNDIIALGNYRLKVEDAPAISPEIKERIKASDTITMASLEDIRRTRAKRTIKALKNH